MTMECFAGSYLYRSLKSLLLAALLTLGLLAPAGQADELNELSLDGWKQLKEVERYQLQIAEKYAREANWKIAAAEYEKFMELYESSSGAPYAQLKWSICQVQLRKQNTAIKEGFQSVIDYWPDSPQATAAAFYIGRTYKEIGRIKEAKKALRDVVAKYPGHLVSIYSMNDLIDISTIENDMPARVEFWKKLAFDTKRNRDSNQSCINASVNLAAYHFREGAFDDGVKSLETTYKPPQLAHRVHEYVRQPLAELMSQSETVAKGGKLADQAMSWLKTQSPTDLATPEAKAEAKRNGLNLLDLLAIAKRDDQVPAAYEQLLKTLGGTDDELLGRLAGFYKSRTKWDDARTTYRRYANKVEGLNQVASSYREQNNLPLAIETYVQAVALAEVDSRGKLQSDLARTYRDAKKVPEAVAVYEDLYKSDTTNSNRWRYAIGETYREAGQLKEAIGHYRQCDNFPEQYKMMAWCHRHLKQYNEAIVLYTQVASDQASAPWAMLQIGYTREEAGQSEQAIQMFQQVCKKFPSDGNASVAHTHLNNKYKIFLTLGGVKDE
ncbi:tol-pal system protein YbgF [Anatilimnocola aggregata]|uniref:Tol-pal system protein YbgF n=1 Tax=Anatilimnocola aggregata TaxID=2528021 RepID=A0A517YM44_9BACT|nr:tetratricopeptide repeat protein [Anatilimnocola aggregata]QDU31297.1 tol-pal system protein YbgF [Anatilimnocola aggregata]